MARLFFAIRPDAAALARLEALARELAAACGGSAVPAARIHLTLAFLGEIDAPCAQIAGEAAQAMERRAFDVALDCVGSFRHSRVAWAGSRSPGARTCSRWWHRTSRPGATLTWRAGSSDRDSRR